MRSMTSSQMTSVKVANVSIVFTESGTFFLRSLWFKFLNHDVPSLIAPNISWEYVEKSGYSSLKKGFFG